MTNYVSNYTLELPRPTESNKYLSTDMVNEAKQALDNVHENEGVSICYSEMIYKLETKMIAMI